MRKEETEMQEEGSKGRNKGWKGGIKKQGKTSGDVRVCQLTYNIPELPWLREHLHLAAKITGELLGF